MIVLVAPALAAGIAAHLESPAAGTPVIELYQADLDGSGTQIAPDRLRLSGSALVDVDLWALERRLVFAESGLGLWTAGWEEETAFPLRLSVWTLPLEVGLRRPRGQESWSVRPYTQGAAGLHLLRLSSREWDDYLVPALAGHWGAGVLLGQRERAFSLQIRASLRARGDSPGGSVETSQGALSWWWTPGEASFSVLAGMRWP